jgi:single-stranded DNA-binding protein
MNTTLTLIGFLGKNREIRATRERTDTFTRYNPVAESDDTYEVTHPSRDFARLSLAERTGGATRWHQLVVWDLDRHQDARAVRLARKGDLVQVTGRRETYRYTSAAGEPHEIEQLVVESFSIRRPKPRCEYP